MELAKVGDGVSASLEVGDGGGREREMEGCQGTKGWVRRGERRRLPAGVFTCEETLSLLLFSLTLARAPFSPDDLSVTSRAALSSLGVSGRTAAAGACGGSLLSSLGSAFFPLFSIFLPIGAEL